MHKFGLIGHPIEHSKSPELFTVAYSGKYKYDLIEGTDFEKSYSRFLKEYQAINVTAPFKGDAFEKADIISGPAALTGAANILVRTKDGVAAYNSDVTGVENILKELEDIRTVAVIGTGGAGRAALQAAFRSGLRATSFHHDQLESVPESDLVIYTLPRPAEGIDLLRCRYLLEANYRDPAFSPEKLSRRGITYIPGERWLREQAAAGFPIMTGEKI